jgi:hypothetical protein
MATIAACLFLVMIAWEAAARDVIVTYDAGGIVADYERKYEEFNDRGNRVVIDGWCASACTLALALPQTCATGRARLGFHAGWNVDWNGRKSYSHSLVARLMDEYPPPIRQWLTDRGGLTPRLKVLQGKELAALVKRCR